MKRFPSLLIAISLLLNCSQAFSTSGPRVNRNETINGQPVQQESPLTLAQIQALLKNRTPDGAVALEIQRRGIDFTATASILEQLRKLGAGRKAIKALEAIGTSTSTPQSPEGKFIILVANFESLDGKNYGVTESLIDRLREATKEYPDTEIKALNSSITAQQGDAVALSIAKEHGAQMVLWGWYAKTQESLMLNLHCQLVQKSPKLILRKEKQTLILPASELESFNVQIRIATETTYLTLLVVGVARLKAGDYEGAIARLTKGINMASVPESMVNPADIYLYRALSYFSKHMNSGKRDLQKALGDLNRAIELDPKKKEAYTLRGIILNVQEDYRPAVSDFSKGIELDAENAFAYVMRGGVYKQLGDHDRASTDFNQALQLTNQRLDEPESRFIRGYIYFLSDAYDQAIEEFEQIGRLNRELLPQVFVFRAGINELKENYDQAILELGKAINLQPTQALFYALRASVYEQKEDYDKAISDYSQAVKLEPNNSDFLTDRGGAYSSKGDTRNALADYERAISLNPDESLIYSSRAKVYVKTKDYDRAEADFNKAVALSPDENTHKERAEFYEKRGNYDRAISDYNEVIKLKPTDSSNFLDRGYAFYKKGDLDRAIQDYDNGIQLDPKSSILYEFRADAYLKNKDDAKALADYGKAIELEPTNPFRYFSRASFYEQKGDFESAIADYDQAIKVKPDDKLAQYFRRSAIGEMLSIGLKAKQKGNSDLALKAYNRALELDPDKSFAYYLRGELYTSKGELERALQDFDSAIRLNPKHKESYLERAQVYEEKGMIDPAVADYDRVIQIDPGSQLVSLYRRSAALNCMDRGLGLEIKGQLEQAITEYSNALKFKPDLADAFFHRGRVYAKKSMTQFAANDLKKVLELSKDLPLRQRAEEELRRLGPK